MGKRSHLARQHKFKSGHVSFCGVFNFLTQSPQLHNVDSSCTNLKELSLKINQFMHVNHVQ